MTFVWIALLVLILGAEGYAIYSKKRGDTLSEHVWLIRTTRIGRAITMPLWAWLTYHFWLEPPSVSATINVWWDDFILIGITLLAALTVTMYEKKDNQK